MVGDDGRPKSAETRGVAGLSSEWSPRVEESLERLPWVTGAVSESDHSNSSDCVAGTSILSSVAFLSRAESLGA